MKIAESQACVRGAHNHQPTLNLVTGGSLEQERRGSKGQGKEEEIHLAIAELFFPFE